MRGGLGNAIGKNEAESVLIHMSMEDGLLNPGEFDKKMVALLGKPATVCLEKEIMLNLVERLGLPPDVLGQKATFDFNAVVLAAEKVALDAQTR